MAGSHSTRPQVHLSPRDLKHLSFCAWQRSQHGSAWPIFVQLNCRCFSKPYDNLHYEHYDLRWMATSGPTGGGGIPLEEYRKDVPPGWDQAHAATYPLKVYMDRVRMWYRLWDGPDESVGRMLAGRLRGRAQSIALQIRLPTPNGDIDVGDASLIRFIDEGMDQILRSYEDTCLRSGDGSYDCGSWCGTTTTEHWTATSWHYRWSSRPKTTTGLVEKHIDLVKLTMAKEQAEAGRWGIEISGEELAAEASMAQNITLSIGGYTPVTMVYGILPRGFLDPEAEAVIGDEDMDAAESVFERPLRLRQIALQASQAAILESRISRAN